MHLKDVNFANKMDIQSTSALGFQPATFVLGQITLAEVIVHKTAVLK